MTPTVTYCVGTYKATAGFTPRSCASSLQKARQTADLTYEKVKLGILDGTFRPGTAVLVVDAGALAKITPQKIHPWQHPEAVVLQYGPY